LEGVCEASLLAGRPRLDAPGFPTDEWSSPALAAVRAWVEGRGRAPGAGLWLYGGAGSGKTTILAGLVLQLRAAGEQVALMTMAGMLGALRTATMCDAAHYEALLDRLGEVPVLALDDVLVRPLSEFQAEAVEQVLNTRWNAGLPVLATSNHALMGMAPGAVLRGCQSVGDVTFSRLRSRLRACAAVEIACFYPGDRRTGDFDKALAATWRAARAQRGGR
jgi:chromosomal replication initiation ATPase DnaA